MKKKTKLLFLLVVIISIMTFVFLSMNKWSLGTSGVPYTEDDITLMEKWIPKMSKFSKVFIFTHLFFPDRAGNFKELYPSGNWLSGT